MEDQIPSSTPPVFRSPATELPMNKITPEALEALKARAREMAVQQVMSRAPETPTFQVPQQTPQVIYVRRSLTVAELILIFALSCGIVAGVQGLWGLVSSSLPRIEIKMK